MKITKHGEGDFVPDWTARPHPYKRKKTETWIIKNMMLMIRGVTIHRCIDVSQFNRMSMCVSAKRIKIQYITMQYII